MAYIGARPVIEFSTLPSKDSFTGDGSTTAFDLADVVPSGGENSLEVFVNNVRQEPGTGKAFTLGADGSNALKRITFSTAPANGASIYVINDKTNTMTLLSPKDLNGVELFLDADADTTITADTDDRIDWKIAGVEHFSFSNSSGDTIIKPMTDAKDIKFQQYDGNLLLDINDGNFVGIGGNSAAPGEIRIYEDSDNGSHYTGFKAGNNTASVAYVLPTADGSSGTALTTNGSGVLSWSASLTIGNDGNNRITTATGSSGINGEANLTFDGSALQVTGTLTVGVDDTGHDVKFFGDTASAFMLWDTSTDDLVLGGAAKLYLFDAGGGEHISSDGTDLTIASGAKIELTATSDIVVPANVGITFGTGEKIEGDSTDLTITSGAKINLTATSDVHLPNDVGIIFGDSAEKIEGDGTDLTISGNNIKLTAAADVILPINIGLHFTDANEKIESNGTNLTITAASGDINLTANADVNLPNDIGLVFGDDGEKIEGDGTDLTIASSNLLNLTATTDVVIPTNVGLHFTDANEKIESDGTNLTISSGAQIIMAATTDVKLANDIGVIFGDAGEKIEGDGTDLTIASSAALNLTAGTDVVIPANIGLTFGSGEKIEGDSTDLTVTSGAKINLTATSDVHIPNDVGIVFGGDSEKIEGDGTDLTISANNLTIDCAADLILDAGGNDFNFKAGGTEVLRITNSSSDVIIRPVVDAKDIIFQQRDGTEVARIEDAGTLNVVTGKLAINATAIAATAAELNIMDGGTSATSTTLVDADRLVANDNGTMVQVAMTDVNTYIGGGTSWQAVKTGNFTAAAGQGVFANTTSSAFTVTLPAGTIGDEVSIIDYAGTFDSNNLTVASNGSEKIHGSTDNLTVATERAAFTLVFTDGTQGWLLKDK
jgi:hypothetical protein